jgi:hypothetical protein
VPLGTYNLQSFADHPATRADPTLLTEANAYLRNALAVSTQSSYSSPQRNFLRFAEQAGVLSPLPADENLLCLWVTSLARRLSHASIPPYLYAVRSLHIDHGFDSPLGGAMLERVLKGIRRAQGDRHVLKRLPVTMLLLDRIRPFLDFALHDDCMFMAALSTATGALLRVGEVVINESEPDRMLTLSDLTASPTSFSLLLRVSKTDPFGKGTHAYVSAPKAVSDMKRYLSLHAKTCPLVAASSPLFAFANGTPLRRRVFLRRTRSLLQQAGIDLSRSRGVSFRRGGATSLAAAGVPDRIIKELGRWKSWVYSIYIATPLQPLLDAAASM